MNIIVEGTDAVGKDLFINTLAKQTGKPIVRGSSFEISEMGSEGMYEFSKQLLLDNDNALINRFFYSNLVYGKLFDYPTMTEEQYEELNDLVSEKAVVYYLTANVDVLTKRIGSRGDEKIISDDLQKIQDGYIEMWKYCTPKTLIVIDTSNDELLNPDSEIYKRVIEHDKEMKYIEDEFTESTETL